MYGAIHAVWIVGLYLIVNYIINKNAFKTILLLRGSEKKQ